MTKSEENNRDTLNTVMGGKSVNALHTECTLWFCVVGAELRSTHEKMPPQNFILGSQLEYCDAF